MTALDDMPPEGLAWFRNEVKQHKNALCIKVCGENHSSFFKCFPFLVKRLPADFDRSDLHTAFQTCSRLLFLLSSIGHKG